MNKNWLFLLAVVFLVSCGKKDCKDEQDISDIHLTVNIESLENQIDAIADTAELSSFLEKHPVISREFFYDLNYPSRPVMLDEVFKIIKSPYTDTLYQQVKATYGNGEQLKLQFEDAFKRIKYYYPEFESPRVQTVVSGFGNDIYLTDSLIVIGLDYYLGEEGKYKPDLYQYLLDRMTPNHLVPSIVMFMSNRYNDSDMSQHTLLDEMVFFGKAYQFTKKVMPCIDEHILEGYTIQQSLDVRVSESFIWSYFIDNSLIYDKNTLNISKFVNERPSVPEVSPQCPGRIGRWLGWQIVQQFEEREDTNLPDLMKIADARDLLMRSKYRPRNR